MLTIVFSIQLACKKEWGRVPKELGEGRRVGFEIGVLKRSEVEMVGL
jgi:hypothetical protein